MISKVAAVAVMAAIALWCVFDPPWVIEKLHSGASSAVAAYGQGFSPAKYVSRIWSGKVLPTVARRAVSLPTLLADLKHHPRAAAKRYGHYAVEGGPPAFLVKGTGRVVSVDTSSQAGKAGIALGSGLKPDVFLQIGPALNGTDVRDAMPFISFSQFVNQVQYGEVAIAINTKIASTVLARLHATSLKERTITFTGAFTFTGSGKPLITPITVTASP